MSPRLFDAAKYLHAQIGAGPAGIGAYVRGGILFLWLARRGLLEGDRGALALRALAAGERISSIYARLADGVMTEEHLTSEGFALLSAWHPDVGDAPVGVAASLPEDFAALEAQTGGPFTTPDEPASAERFAAVFDRRLAEWRAAGSPGAAVGAMELDIALLGIPGPWPAWNTVTNWRPDTAAQQEAARAVRGAWVGLVATDVAARVEPTVGRVGALASVRSAAADGSRLALALPGLVRFRVRGAGAGGTARVARVTEPVVRIEPEVRSQILAVASAWDGECGAGEAADRAAWPRLRSTGDLRALVEAVDPLDRLQVAMRLARRSAP